METNFGGRNYGRHDHQRRQIVEMLKLGKTVAYAREDGFYRCELGPGDTIIERLIPRAELEIKFVSIDEVSNWRDEAREMTDDKFRRLFLNNWDGI